MTQIDNLLLVGTVHSDPLGRERLQKLLDWYRPESISLEVSPQYYFDEIRKNYDEEFEYHSQFNLNMSTGLGLLDIFNTKRQEFEDGHHINSLNVWRHYFDIIVPTDYAANHGISCLFSESHELLERFSDFVSGFERRNKNQKALEYIQSVYASPGSCSHEMMELIKKRDAYMEKNIREKLFGRAMHIGGAFHFYGDYKNLYESLSDLNVKRMKLCDDLESTLGNWGANND